MLAVKTVLVTGGGRGIGREIALDLAQKGAQIAVAARSEAELAETLSELKAIQPRVLAQVCDVANPKDVETLFRRIESDLGPVDGLVSAAAIHGPIGPFLENDLAAWQSVLEVNVMGTVHCVQKLAQSLVARRASGRIVLFSGGGEKAFSGFSAYVASKGAIWRLTETLGAELKEKGIFINAIAPGAVNTKLLQNVLDAGPDKVGGDYFQKSLEQKEKGGTPASKAVALVRYLLSEKAEGLTGKILSAVWDPYEKFTDLDKLSRSDWFTMRRLVPKDLEEMK